MSTFLEAARVYAAANPHDTAHAETLHRLDPGWRATPEPAAAAPNRPLNVGAVRARRTATAARSTAAPVPVAPQTPTRPDRPMDLTGLRRTASARDEVPPRLTATAIRFNVGSRLAWTDISPDLPDRGLWFPLITRLVAASGVLDSASVVLEPRTGQDAGLLHIGTGHGQTWARISVDSREPRHVQARTLRHELGHLVDVAAAGANWPALGETARRRTAETWAEHCETWLSPRVTADEALTECRRFLRAARTAGSRHRA